jgi:hypothetical protein
VPLSARFGGRVGCPFLLFRAVLSASHILSHSKGQNRGASLPHAIKLDCANDAAAVESAKQLVSDHDVELWQENRMATKPTSSDPK